MNPTDLQSVLSAVLREQEQRLVQLLEALRVARSSSEAVAPPAQGNLPLRQLSDIESFVVDVKNLTHFDEWLRRFEISLLCAAPKISEKEETMVIVTKLLTDAFAEFRKCCLPEDVTAYIYEEAVTRSVSGLRFSSVSNAPYFPTVTTIYVSLGTKGKSSCT
jgi:hypothetical protein